jgi:hypothetical protein
MGVVRRGVLACCVLLVLFIAEAHQPAGVGWCADPARVTARFSPTARDGWTEALLIITAGDQAWSGTVAVATAAAKMRLKLSLPARGQRVVPVPFWIAAGSGAPQIWVDGIRIGSMIPSVAGETRILLPPQGGESHAGPGLPTGAIVSLPLSEWPETWRAYEAFELVVLPAASIAALRPEQSHALEQWLHWGGAAAAVEADRTDSGGLKPIGAGAGIAARTAADAWKAYSAWAARGGSATVSRALLGKWERARGGIEKTTWDLRWPAPALAIVALGYLLSLAAAAAALACCPALRRFGVRLVLLVLLCGTCATVAVAQGGSGGVEVKEVTLLRDRGEGWTTHASAVIQARSARRVTLPFTPVFRQAALYELEPSQGRLHPQRSIQWNVDGNSWERELVVGESAVIRVDGIGPDLGIRVHGRPDGVQVENGGSFTLRDLVLFSAGGLLPIRDLGPGEQILLDASRLRDTARWASASPAMFWAPLLPSAEAGRIREPMLLAKLDPSVPAVRMGGNDARLTTETYVVLSLPNASEWRGAGPTRR